MWAHGEENDAFRRRRRDSWRLTDERIVIDLTSVRMQGLPVGEGHGVLVLSWIDEVHHVAR